MFYEIYSKYLTLNEFNFLTRYLLQTLKNTSKSIRWLLLNLRDNDQVLILL